jgi:hypothetical protein
MPSNIELIVGRNNILVEYFEWRFKQGRTGPLQDHRSLFRKIGYQVAGVNAARQSEVDRLAGGYGLRHEREPCHSTSCEKRPSADTFRNKSHIREPSSEFK